MEKASFNYEETGGNCTAYVYSWESDRKHEILFTDGDMTAPKDLAAFPISVSYYIDGYFEEGFDAYSREDLFVFVSKKLEREISEIELVRD
jgi:hypothetical protein